MHIYVSMYVEADEILTYDCIIQYIIHTHIYFFNI